MSRHVVFGTGQIGRHLINQLVGLGHDVIAVNRRGGSMPNAEVVAGDATDPAFTTAPASTPAATPAGRQSSHPCSRGS